MRLGCAGSEHPDTRPLDAASRLQPLTLVANTGTVFWVQMTPTSTGRTYDLLYSTNLVGAPWASKAAWPGRFVPSGSLRWSIGIAGRLGMRTHRTEAEPAEGER